MKKETELSLSNIPLLSPDGFDIWKIRMVALTHAKDCFNICTGKEKKPKKVPDGWALWNERKKNAYRKSYPKLKASYDLRKKRAWLYIVQSCGTEYLSLISPFQDKMNVAKAWSAIFQHFNENDSPGMSCKHT